jgi:hypothetical protein
MTLEEIKASLDLVQGCITQLQHALNQPEGHIHPRAHTTLNEMKRSAQLASIELEDIAQAIEEYQSSTLGCLNLYPK